VRICATYPSSSSITGAFLSLGSSFKRTPGTNISDDLVLAAVIFESSADVRSGNIVNVQALNIPDGRHWHLVFHPLRAQLWNNELARTSVHVDLFTWGKVSFDEHRTLLVFEPEVFLLLGDHNTSLFHDTLNVSQNV